MAYTFGYILGQAFALTLILGIPIVVIALVLKKIFKKKEVA
jgi:ABC-type sugar transport system permease subunit